MDSIYIGYGNYISADKVLTITNADSRPAKRFRREKKAKGLLIDCSGGKKARSLIVMMGGQIVLSRYQPETVRQRMDG